MKPEKTFIKYPVRSEKLLQSGSQAGQGKQPRKVLQRHQLPTALWDQTSMGQPPDYVLSLNLIKIILIKFALP